MIYEHMQKYLGAEYTVKKALFLYQLWCFIICPWCRDSYNMYVLVLQANLYISLHALKHPNMPRWLSDDSTPAGALAPSPCEFASDPRQLRRLQIVWHWHLQPCKVRTIHKSKIYTGIQQRPKQILSITLGVTCLAHRPATPNSLPTTRVHEIVTYMVSVLIEWVHGAQWGCSIQLEAGSSSGLPQNVSILELTARRHGGQFLQ